MDTSAAHVDNDAVLIVLRFRRQIVANAALRSARAQTGRWSGPKRAINHSGDLLARAGVNRTAEGHTPAFGSHCRPCEPQVRKYGALIDVDGDLFGAAPGSDVLGADQRRAATLAREADQVFGHQWYGAPRAFLPRCVGGRVDDNLPDHSPTRVVRIAARDEKPRQCLCQPQRSWLAAVAVQVSQGGPHVAAGIDRPGELPRSHPRLAWFVLDPSSLHARDLGSVRRAAPTHAPGHRVALRTRAS